MKELPGLATAIDDISLGATVFIMFQGERWQAKSEHEVKKGQKLRVLKKEEHYLIVEPEG